MVGRPFLLTLADLSLYGSFSFCLPLYEIIMVTS